MIQLNKNTKYAFLDGDMLLFRLAWQVDKLGIRKMPTILRNITKSWVPRGYVPILCLSDARWRNFRRLYWKDYKLNREGMGGGPDSLKDLRTRAYNSQIYPGVWHQIGAEADDLMAIGALENPGNSIIVSCDKDMLQVPTVHYHPVNKTTTIITPEEGKKLLNAQWIKGDMTDHIPGIYKHGPKAADRILTGKDPEKEIVLRYYLTHEYNPYPKKYNMTWEEYCQAMYRCVRLCQTREELEKETSICASITRPGQPPSASSQPGASNEPPMSE